MKKQVILLCVLLLGFLNSSQIAKTIYFKPIGTPNVDLDIGSYNYPFRDFKFVLEKVEPGDTIALLCDWDALNLTYWSNRNTCLYGNLPGSIVNWFNITFDGNDNRIFSVYNGDGFTLHFAKCNSITVKNMTIERIDPLNSSSTNYNGSIRLRESKYCILSNLEIITNGDLLGAGISLHQSSYNKIYNIRAKITGSRSLHFAYLYHRSNYNFFDNCTIDTYGPNKENPKKGPPIKVRDDCINNVFNNINVIAHTPILAGWIESYVQGTESYSKNNKITNCTFIDSFSNSIVPKIKYNMYANSNYSLNHPAVQGYWTDPNMQDYVVGEDPGYINQKSNVFSDICKHWPDNHAYSRYFPLFNVTTTEPNINIKWKDWEDRWEISCNDNKPRVFSVNIRKFLSKELIKSYYMEHWVVKKENWAGSKYYCIEGANEVILFSLENMQYNFDLFLLPGDINESMINGLKDNVGWLKKSAIKGCSSQNRGTLKDSFSKYLSKGKKYWAVVYKVSQEGYYKFYAKPIGATNKISYEPSEENSRNNVKKYHLMGAYPNPFNPSTNIDYQIPMDSFVSLIVYDILGQKVTVLVNKYQTRGKYSVRFVANNLPSGVYIYKLQAGVFSSVKKMLLTK